MPSEDNLLADTDTAIDRNKLIDMNVAGLSKQIY